MKNLHLLQPTCNPTAPIKFHLLTLVVRGHTPVGPVLWSCGPEIHGLEILNTKLSHVQLFRFQLSNIQLFRFQLFGIQLYNVQLLKAQLFSFQLPGPTYLGACVCVCVRARVLTEVCAVVKKVISHSGLVGN